MSTFPLYADVNGHRTAYSSIQLGIAGAPPIHARAINYGGDTEFGMVYGNSPKPIGRTRGRNTFEGASLELYQREWRNLLPILTAAGLYGFSELAFPITVVYAEEQSPLDIVIDELIGVRFGEPRDAHSEGGADAVFVTIPLSIMDILRNGFQGLRTFL